MAFEALEVAVEAVRALRGPVKRLRTVDPDLAGQIKRAAGGVVLQLSEGARRVGRDRLHLFRIAAGSAAEARDALRVVEGWGELEAEDLEAPKALLDRVLAMTWRLTHP